MMSSQFIMLEEVSNSTEENRVELSNCIDTELLVTKNMDKLCWQSQN